MCPSGLRCSPGTTVRGRLRQGFESLHLCFLIEENKLSNQKTFVIINSYLIGDIILVNSLVQNIKRIWKDSKVVMLSSSKLIDVCKNQEGVDDVIIWDRHGKHKSFLGMLKFILTFPYKNIYAAFPIYGMDRPVLLSFLLGAKYILFKKIGRKNIFDRLFKSKYKLKEIDKSNFTTQNMHLNLLSGITKEELIDCKIKYNLDNQNQIINDLQDYITLCPISSRPTKDMPYETVVDLIKNSTKKVILLGSGKTSQELSEKLKNENLDNLIDYSNKTSINEAAHIISNSIGGIISVDTGLMHIACALDKPTVAVFYEVKNSPFIPKEELYNTKTIVENQTAENILSTLNSIV